MFCPTELGWPIRRKRQISVLLHKQWIFRALAAAGAAHMCTPEKVLEAIDLRGTLSALCERPVELTWRDFLVADADDLAYDKACDPGMRLLPPYLP